LIGESGVSQKCLAARSPSSTAPETAVTATMLIRFCVAIDIVDAAWIAAWLDLNFLPFFLFGIVFPAIATPKMAGQARMAALTLTLSLSRFVPDQLAATMS
jgi:hypothetical protein